MSTNIDLTERITSTERIFEGRIVNLRVDAVMLPNGKESKREIVEHGGAVAILPIDSEGNVILVRQFRLPTEGVLLEAPAGGMEPGEDPKETAARELAEEIGFVPKDLTHLCSVYLAPGYSTEKIHCYLAEDLAPKNAHTDIDEFIEVVKMTLKEAFDAIANGEIEDAKTVVCLTLAERLLRMRQL